MRVDLCRDCVRNPDAAKIANYLVREEYQRHFTATEVALQIAAAGTNAWGHDHPPYDAEEFECGMCGRVLVEADS